MYKVVVIVQLKIASTILCISISWSSTVKGRRGVREGTRILKAPIFALVCYTAVFSVV